MSGPEADEFMLKVQQAATGPPWYSHAKPVVNFVLIICIYESLCAFPLRISIIGLPLCKSKRSMVVRNQPHRYGN